MGTTTAISPFRAGPSPDPTVGQSRRKTRIMKKLRQKRSSKIIQAMKDAYTVQR